MTVGIWVSVSENRSIRFGACMLCLGGENQFCIEKELAQLVSQ